MAAAPIDLSAGLVPKPIDISAGLVPKDATPAPQSLWEKAKANFNSNTQGPLPGDTGIKAQLAKFGQGGGDVIRALAHPVDTATNMAQQGIEDIKQGNDPGMATLGRTAVSLYKEPARTLGQLGTSTVLGELGGAAVGPVLRGASAASDAVGDAATALKAKVYPTSQSTVPAVSSARNLAKALVVAPVAEPNFIRAATDEAGTIVDFAQKNNLPINSKVDFANAAKAAADAVQSHYGDAILKPNAGKVVSVPPNYRGSTVGEGPNATLGAVDARLNQINTELSPNYRQATQAKTNAANVSDADLMAEQRALAQTLHRNLAQATGLTPEEIAAVRQQAGKLRTIADESSLSANQDTSAAGKQAMGATTSAVGTKVGLIDRALQYAQGGPEIIGNRQINRALGTIQPKPLNLPQPTSTGVAAPPIARISITGASTSIPLADYTPDPTAGEILRSRIQGRLKPKSSPSPMN